MFEGTNFFELVLLIWGALYGYAFIQNPLVGIAGVIIIVFLSIIAMRHKTRHEGDNYNKVFFFVKKILFWIALLLILPIAVPMAFSIVGRIFGF